MAKVPAIYCAPSSGTSRWRTYYRPGETSWSDPECVAFNDNAMSVNPYSSGSFIYLPGHSEDGFLLERASLPYKTLFFTKPGYYNDNFIDSGAGFQTNLGADGGGPLRVGSAIYVWGAYSGVAATVYKSTDGGLNWTEQDGSNAPLPGTSGTYNVFYAESQNKLYFAMRYSSTAYRIRAFDFTTDTWDALLTTYTATLTGYREVFVRSNGDVVLLFYDNGLAYVAYYSGGSWTTSSSISASYTITGTMDANDMLHFYYTNFSGGYYSYYNTFSASNVLGTPYDITTNYGLNPASQHYPTSAVIYNGEPWALFTGIPSNFGVQSIPYLVGTPDSGTNPFRDTHPVADYVFDPTYKTISLEANPCSCTGGSRSNVMY